MGSTNSSSEGRWKWRQVSPRRVIGSFLAGLGGSGVLVAITDGLLGPWNAELDPGFAIGSAVMAAAGFGLLWRVKPAPWP